MSQLLTIGQVTERLGVSADIIRAAEERGEIKSVHTPGKHRRFRPEDVDALKARWRAVPSRPKKGPARDLATGPRPPVRRVDPELVHPDEGLVEFDEPDAIREAELEAARERKAAAETERQRLQALKEYGRQLVTWRFVADEVKAEVIADLEANVTAKQFPAWLPDAQAYGFIQARVDAVIKRYRHEEARKAEEEHKVDEARRAEQVQRADEERAERRIDDLIEYGMRLPLNRLGSVRPPRYSRADYPHRALLLAPREKRADGA